MRSDDLNSSYSIGNSWRLGAVSGKRKPEFCVGSIATALPDLWQVWSTPSEPTWRPHTDFVAMGHKQSLLPNVIALPRIHNVGLLLFVARAVCLLDWPETVLFVELASVLVSLECPEAQA